jgi:hypothetical protein
MKILVPVIWAHRYFYWDLQSAARKEVDYDQVCQAYAMGIESNDSSSILTQEGREKKRRLMNLYARLVGSIPEENVNVAWNESQCSQIMKIVIEWYQNGLINTEYETWNPSQELHHLSWTYVTYAHKFARMAVHLERQVGPPAYTQFFNVGQLLQLTTSTELRILSPPGDYACGCHSTERHWYSSCPLVLSPLEKPPQRVSMTTGTPLQYYVLAMNDHILDMIFLWKRLTTLILKQLNKLSPMNRNEWTGVEIEMVNMKARNLLTHTWEKIPVLEVSMNHDRAIKRIETRFEPFLKEMEKVCVLARNLTWPVHNELIAAVHLTYHVVIQHLAYVLLTMPADQKDRWFQPIQFELQKWMEYDPAACNQGYMLIEILPEFYERFAKHGLIRNGLYRGGMPTSIPQPIISYSEQARQLPQTSDNDNINNELQGASAAFPSCQRHDEPSSSWMTAYTPGDMEEDDE